MSTRLLFLCSLGVIAAAQPSPSPFPRYDAIAGNPTFGMPSYDSPKDNATRSGRWQNIEPPESGEFGVAPPPAAAAVSTDQLRHPLRGKALQMIQRAEKLIRARNYTHAKEELQKAVQNPQAAPYAHSLLGQEYVRSSEYAEAVKELEQAIQLLPSSVPDHANLGYALFMTGQAGPAEKELRRALELQPSNPRTHLVLGLVCYIDKSRDQETEEHLKFAARELPAAHLMLAKFYQATSRLDAAEREALAYAQLTGSTDSMVGRQQIEKPEGSAPQR